MLDKNVKTNKKKKGKATNGIPEGGNVNKIISTEKHVINTQDNVQEKTFQKKRKKQNEDYTSPENQEPKKNKTNPKKLKKADESEESDEDVGPSNKNINKLENYADVSSSEEEEEEEDSELSDADSRSDVSHIDMDSYPSDTDDDEDVRVKNQPETSSKSVQSAETEERENRTVFVGNLPSMVERPDLKKWFSKFGKVQCVRLRSAPIADPTLPRKVSVITKTFHENRSTIHAYVRFESLEAAENSLQANGSVYKNHTIRVDRSKHEGGYDSRKGIFVGNVPFTLEEEALRQLFSTCGEIDNVRIVRDKATGAGKGFAYVNFRCSTSVALALRMDGEILEKRELRVKPNNYKKSRKQATGPQRLSFFNNKNVNHQNNKGNKPYSKIRMNLKNKQNKPYQGLESKRKEKKSFKKKSAEIKKRELVSRIFTNTSNKNGAVKKIKISKS